jgi:hypothetical protein
MDQINPRRWFRLLCRTALKYAAPAVIAVAVPQRDVLHLCQDRAQFHHIRNDAWSSALCGVEQDDSIAGRDGPDRRLLNVATGIA